MKIRILGCYGGKLPKYRTCSFLINDSLLIDAGAIAAVLNLREQLKIRHILVSHAHLDHIKDIPFLADNIFFENTHSVNVISTHRIIEQMRKHLLNNLIWPDFTIMPTKKAPILKAKPIRVGREIKLDGITVKAIKVNHTVETVGYIIRDGKSAFVYSGDTGPTERLWKEVNKIKNLKAIFIETSFPDGMSRTAEASRHFTPVTMKRELKKINHSHVPIYVYHLKPQYIKAIQKEIKAFRDPNITILAPETIFKF
ncbi:MAG: 3',5'-cyclic-nucleotide phosphodiesterase [Deltaproteobacteria bacterium]|nr:MAG: 3',5'-cyclic-nucleotide phosphodiesterase [Deltaproteobacteria bacterium]